MYVYEVTLKDGTVKRIEADAAEMGVQGGVVFYYVIVRPSKSSASRPGDTTEKREPFAAYQKTEQCLRLP